MRETNVENGTQNSTPRDTSLGLISEYQYSFQQLTLSYLWRKSKSVKWEGYIYLHAIGSHCEYIENLPMSIVHKPFESSPVPRGRTLVNISVSFTLNYTYL